MSQKYNPPPYLKKGDSVAIMSMASAVSEEAVYKAKKILEEKGFNVVLDENIFAKEFNFAGNDEIRQDSLQKWLNETKIKAICSSRGGYGVSKIIDQLDFKTFQKSPKWIVGFSDITALHLKIQSLGIQSLHGPMPSTFGYDEHSVELMIKRLMGEGIEESVDYCSLNRLGTAEGPIVGGNLCLLAHSIGSACDINYDNHILFLEDIGEYAYNIDRMMLQLKRAGKFKQLAGLVIGDFSDTKENDSPFGKTVEEIIISHVKEYQFPVAFNFPIGHEHINHAIRNGEQLQLQVNQKHSILKSNSVNDIS